MAIQGQLWLAKKLGISQPRVAKLVKDPDWPFGKGPWKAGDVPAIQRHMSERRAGNNATAESADDNAIAALSRNPEKVARIKLVVERTAKIKLERELLAGGYLKKEDVEKDRITRVYAVRAKMMEIPLRCSLIAHKSEAECEAILTDWMKDVCDHFAGSA